MKQFVLLGYPLGHSISPQLHQALMERSGIDGHYSLFATSTLMEAVPLLRELDGFNVTIPYKQELIPFLDELDDTARLLGAVNTVKKVDGRLIGSNTDCLGFEKALDACGITLSGKKVCVVGIGGVGRTFALCAAAAGAKQVTLGICRRHLARAEVLQSQLSDRFPEVQIRTVLTDVLASPCDVLLNATPCGMFPHTDESPVPTRFLPQVQCLFDSIYNPQETLLMRQAKAAGCQVVEGGLGMLVWQGVFAQQIWNGTGFTNEQVAEVRDILQQSLCNNASA